MFKSKGAVGAEGRDLTKPRVATYKNEKKNKNETAGR